MVIFGIVAGAVLLVNWRAPRRSHGINHNTHTSQAHPRRKFVINLLRRVRSSCFPKIMPTIPRANHPPRVKKIERGIKARNTPTPNHEPSHQLSHMSARSTMKIIIPRNIRGCLIFFYGVNISEKCTKFCENYIVCR